MTSLQYELHRIITAYGEEAPDFQASLRDMLTDVRHVACFLELDFDFAVEGSGEVYHLESLEKED